MQVPPVQSGDANISIQMPSLRSLHCSQSVHQSAQTGSGEAEVNRHSSSDIHRRYAPNGTLQHIAQRASICNPVPSREHRVLDQQQEISVTANPRNRISWNDNRFSENGLEISRREDQEHQTGGTEIAQSLQPLSSLPIPTSWQAKCNHPSTSDGSFILPLSPDLLETSSGSQLAGLQVPCSAISPGKRGPLVVGTPPIHMERQEPDYAASLHDNNFGYFTSRVGSYLQRSTDQRSMVTGANTSYQLSGASGSHSSRSDLCKGEVRHYNPLEIRQYHCSRLHQQNGENSITYAISSNQGSMVMVHGKEYPVTS